MQPGSLPFLSSRTSLLAHLYREKLAEVQQAEEGERFGTASLNRGCDLPATKHAH